LMPRVYRHWYHWSDRGVLEAILRERRRPGLLVVEVATGPNVAVPRAVGRAAPSSRYVTLDVEREHILLQRAGSGGVEVEGVVADATCPPLVDGCADIFVFHHAIDDIFETRGVEGVRASVEAALRALRGGGCLVFSHSVFASDPFTERVGLADVRALLEGRIRGQIQELEGPAQSWLIVRDVHTREERPET